MFFAFEQLPSLQNGKIVLKIDQLSGTDQQILIGCANSREHFKQITQTHLISSCDYLELSKYRDQMEEYILNLNLVLKMDKLKELDNPCFSYRLFLSDDPLFTTCALSVLQAYQCELLMATMIECLQLQLSVSKFIRIQNNIVCFTSQININDESLLINHILDMLQHAIGSLNRLSSINGITTNTQLPIEFQQLTITALTELLECNRNFIELESLRGVGNTRKITSLLRQSQQKVELIRKFFSQAKITLDQRFSWYLKAAQVYFEAYYLWCQLQQNQAGVEQQYINNDNSSNVPNLSNNITQQMKSIYSRHILLETSINKFSEYLSQFLQNCISTDNEGQIECLKKKIKIKDFQSEDQQQQSGQACLYPPWILEYLLTKTKYFKELSFNQHTNRFQNQSQLDSETLAIKKFKSKLGQFKEVSFKEPSFELIMNFLLILLSDYQLIAQEFISSATKNIFFQDERTDLTKMLLNYSQECTQTCLKFVDQDFLTIRLTNKNLRSFLLYQLQHIVEYTDSLVLAQQQQKDTQIKFASNINDLIDKLTTLNQINEDTNNEEIFVKRIELVPLVQEAYQIIEKILLNGNVNKTILNTFRMFDQAFDEVQLTHLYTKQISNWELQKELTTLIPRDEIVVFNLLTHLGINAITLPNGGIALSLKFLNYNYETRQKSTFKLKVAQLVLVLFHELYHQKRVVLGNDFRYMKKTPPKDKDLTIKEAGEFQFFELLTRDVICSLSAQSVELIINPMNWHDDAYELRQSLKSDKLKKLEIQTNDKNQSAYHNDNQEDFMCGNRYRLMELENINSKQYKTRQ